MESGADPGAAPMTSEQLAAIEDENVLNQMLDTAADFEERRLIRAALRDLLKRKRDQREQQRGSRQQDLRQQGLTRSPPPSKPGAPSAASRAGPTAEAGEGGEGGGGGGGGGRGAPSAAATKNVKQMLLDWCRAKTEPYEGVDIHNFSSSWKDGIAFCALIHRFFPDAFEYSTLNPNAPRDNFQLAFSAAERLAGCPPLLDADDLVLMKEPDWKCVYTYIQELYRCLVERGLVKTKRRP